MKPASRLILTTSPPAEAGGKTSGITVLRCRRRLPCRGIRYRPTGKELDTETGLYYFGARYLDPKTGRWISGDPAISDYIPSAPINDEARRRNGSLPGVGGVYNVFNMHVYAYTHNNPVKFIDPDGRNPILDVDGNLLGTTGQNEWAGVPIVMYKDEYVPGMSQEDVLSKGTRLNEYGKGIRITNETWNAIRKNGGDRRLKPYVVNNSNDTIFYKPENDTGDGYRTAKAYDVGAGNDLYVQVDGVKTRAMQMDKVFKIPNGGRVTINEQGRPRSYNFLLILNMYGNVNAPDGDWYELRDAFAYPRLYSP